MRTLLAVALLTTSASARADPVRSDEEVAERLAFIERRLEAGTPAAKRWSYGWFSAYGALTVGQFGAALVTGDAGGRKDLAVGAVSSSLGTLPFALFPFTPRFAAAELGRYPATTPAEKRRKLAAGERLLKASAAAETAGRSWTAHAGCLGVNIAFGLVLVAGYHRTRSGLNSMLLGTGIGEIQIFTQPTDAIDDWNAYRRGDFSDPVSSRIRFEILPAPGGLAFGARF